MTKNVLTIISILLLLSILIILNTQPVTSIDTTGNQLYYTFDKSDASGLTGNQEDYSNSNHNGTSIIPYGQNLRGVLRNSTYLESGGGTRGYYVQDSATAFDGTGDFSVCGWFNVNLSTQQTLLDSNPASRFGVSIINTDTLRTFIGGSSYDSSSIAQNNTWNFFCSNRNNGYLTYYINGITDGVNHSAGNNRVLDLIQFGRSPFSSPKFVGLMDEVSIWNRTLSESEMDELYNNGSGFNPYYVNTPPIVNANITNVPITINDTEAYGECNAYDVDEYDNEFFNFTYEWKLENFSIGNNINVTYVFMGENLTFTCNVSDQYNTTTDSYTTNIIGYTPTSPTNETNETSNDLTGMSIEEVTPKITNLLIPIFILLFLFGIMSIAGIWVRPLFAVGLIGLVIVIFVYAIRVLVTI